VTTRTYGRNAKEEEDGPRGAKAQSGAEGKVRGEPTAATLKIMVSVKY